MNIDEYMRIKSFIDLYNKMSDEEKSLYLNHVQHTELMNSIGRSEQQIEEVSKRIGEHPFASDLLANVAGNYITEGISWVFRSLMRKL